MLDNRLIARLIGLFLCNFLANRIFRQLAQCKKVTEKIGLKKVIFL